MDKLLEQKEELEKQLINLQSEIEMGTILDDQDMISQSQKNIEEINKLISEIDQKIELLGAKDEKKKAISEKYPEQYIYERIKAMSEEELHEYTSGQLSINKEKKNSIEKELENLTKNESVLSGQLLETETRIVEIKEEFKNSHNQELLVAAKELVEKQKNIKQEIEQLKAQIEAKNQELTEIGPTEMTPEEIRHNMIAQLEGNYKETEMSQTYEYIQQLQAEGKSLEEITESINTATGKTTPKTVKEEYIESNEYKTYKEILSKNSKFLDDKEYMEYCSMSTYEDITRLIAYYDGLTKDESLNSDIRSAARQIVDSLNELKTAMDQVLPNVIRNDELREKAKEHSITYEEAEEAKKIYPIVSEIARTISHKKHHIRCNQNIIDVSIAYVFDDKILENSERFDEYNWLYLSDEKRDIETIKEQDVAFEVFISAVIKENREGIKVPQEVDDKYRESEHQGDMIIKKAHKVIETAFSKEQKISEKAVNNDIIEELSKNTSSLPGQYTVEDIENYIVEQEYIKETKEAALKDSEERKVELSNKTSEVELSKINDEEELKRMFETPEVSEAALKEAKAY